MTPANVEVELHAFVEFALFGVLPEHRFEKIGGLLIFVALQSFETTFIQRDRIDVSRSSLRFRGFGRVRWPYRCSNVNSAPGSAFDWPRTDGLGGFLLRPPELGHGSVRPQKHEIEENLV
jgi:hypothetical protein